VYRFVIVLVLAGCYSPSYRDCQFQCSSVDTCPAGMECNGNVCRLEGFSGPCVAMEVDAEVSDGAPGDMPEMLDWTTPVEVVLGGGPWSSPTLNADESEMFLEGSNAEIFRTIRGATTWGPPVLANGIEAAGAHNLSPMLSRDAKTIYFGTDRGLPAPDVWRATRTNATDTSFQGATVMSQAQLNIADKNDSGGSVTADGNLILFTSDRGATIAIYSSMISGGGWGAPVLVSELDSGDSDSHPSITADGNTVVFTSNRLGADYDIYIATRTDRSMPFSNPMRIPAMSAPATPEVDPWISGDGTVIYFGKGISANRKIYRSTRN